MKTQANMHVISHTHWDREWYLSFEQFRLRLVDLMDNLLQLLEDDPGFRCFHLDGQTIVLEDYLEIRPRRRDLLEGLVRAGRILVGPWYLQNDEFLTSGEATVRNLLCGHRIAESFGAVMPIGYLPDQFGHISQMPQILNGFGIENAVFGRGYDIQEHKNMEFFWESPDGSRVLAVNLPAWYNNAQRLPEDPDQAAKLIGIIKGRLDPYTTLPHYLLMNGVDHLEAQENLTAVLRALSGRLPAGQQIVHSTLTDYFRDVAAELAKREESGGKRLPVYRGELREGTDEHILAGTLSSRVYLKQLNDAAQDRMEKWVEPASVWAEWSGVSSYPVDYIDYAWRELLKNHPHDSICGCSIDAVHDQMVDRFHRQKEVADGILDQALGKLAAQVDRSALGGDDQLLVVFNPSQRPRSDLVEATVDFLAAHDVTGLRLEDAAGREARFEIVERTRVGRQVLSPINLPGVVDVDRFRILFAAADVPACGYTSYAVRALRAAQAATATGTTSATASATAIAASSAGKEYSPEVSGASGDGLWDGADRDDDAAVLENEFLRVQVKTSGAVDVFDKANEALYRDALAFEDGGDVGNAYIYQPPAKDVVYTTRDEKPSAIRSRQGQLSDTCEIVYEWPLPSEAGEDYSGRSAELVPCRVTVSLTLASGARRVDCRTSVANNIKDHRLRVLVRTGLKADKAWSGSQFDVVERPANVGGRWKRFANTDANYRFVDVSNGERGLAVLNSGLHEYELLPAEGGTIALTLLRAVGVISERNLTFPRVHELVPGAQVLGTHEFRFALFPHQGGYTDGEVVLEAEEFANAPRAVAVPVNKNEWAHGRPWVQEAGVTGAYERTDPTAKLPPSPRRESFVTVTGKNLILSALKKAETGSGYIVRIFNAGSVPSQLKATFSKPVTDAWRANLAEEKQEALAVDEENARSVVTTSVRPKEIVTLLVDVECSSVTAQWLDRGQLELGT